jgi:hypothetical protein
MKNAFSDSVILPAKLKFYFCPGNFGHALATLKK